MLFIAVFSEHGTVPGAEMFIKCMNASPETSLFAGVGGWGGKRSGKAFRCRGDLRELIRNIRDGVPGWLRS